jgi:hypothetical protein
MVVRHSARVKPPPMPANANADFDKLAAVLREAEAGVRPGSRALTSFRADVDKLAVDGVKRALLEGLGPDGSDTKALAESTLRNRAGTGPPRVPRNSGSRIYQGLTGEWGSQGGRSVLEIGVQGVDFARFVLADRPLGIHPEAMRAIGDRQTRLPGDIIKSGGGG